MGQSEVLGEFQLLVHTNVCSVDQMDQMSTVPHVYVLILFNAYILSIKKY